MKRLPKGVKLECLKCRYYTGKKEHGYYKCHTRRCPVHDPIYDRKPVVKKKFKVTRIWYIEGKDIQDAIDKSKNWDHDEVIVAVKETASGEKYHTIHDKNMYNTD